MLKYCIEEAEVQATLAAQKCSIDIIERRMVEA